MANTIITKNSSSASNVPTAGEMVEGELAVNTADGRLWSKTATTVFELTDHDNLTNYVAGEHFLQSAITTVGTIGTGVWQGTAINQTYLVGQSGTNTGDNSVNTLYSGLVSDTGEPATLRSGGTPTLNTGVTAAEMRTLIGAGTGDGTVTSVVSSGAINHSGTTSVTISHETAAGSKHIPTGGATNNFLKYSASGTAVWSAVATSDIANLSGTNTGDNAVNTLYSSLVSDTGEPATLRSGGTPTLNTGVTAAEMRTLIGAGTGDGTVTGTGTDNYIATWNGTTAINADANSFLIANAVNKAAVETITGAWRFDGQVNIDTASNATPLRVSRTGTAGEEVRVGVGDSAADFYYQNDEAAATMRWTIENTDTESGGGAAANTTVVEFYGGSTTPLFDIRDGTNLRIRDSLDTSYVSISHDANDLNITGTGAVDIDVAGYTNLQCGAMNIVTTGTVSGINITSGANPGHTHTGSSISGLAAGDITSGTFSNAFLASVNGTVTNGTHSGTNTGDNAVNSLYSGLVTDSGEPATLRSGGTPTLNTGVTAAEMRTLIGAGTSSTTGTVTNVNDGNGMTFTAITGSGDVTMGTPGSITDTSTNAVTTNSHTHAVSHTGTGNFAMAVSPTFTGTVTLPQTNMADTDLNRPVLEDYAVKHTAPTVSGNAVTVNCVNGNSFAIDMDPATAAVTLTLSNPPASGRYGEVNLHITMGTPAYDITWPGTVTWQGGGAPTLTSTNNEVDLVHLFTIDGGTNWYGTYATAAGGAGALAGLSDTTITSPTDGALLLYDTGTATWRDATMSGDATITDAGAVTLANDYLRADAADIKTTGHLTFNDNVKAEFGTGGDADLYFDGSDFNMIMAATVDFRLKGGSSVPEVMITALADGAVSLAYNGSPKLATTNTGASVTGNLDVSSGVDVTGALKVLQSTQSFNFTLDASNAKILSTGASPKNILIDGPSVALQDGGTTQLITQTHTTADKLTGVQIRHTNGTLYDAGLSHMTRGTNSPSDDADVTGTGTYTVTEDDWHRTLRVNTTSTKTINFPSLSDVKNGAVLWIMNINTGVLTISASTTLQWMDGSGTSKTGNRTLARWGWITVWKLSDTVYYVTGSGLS